MHPSGEQLGEIDALIDTDVLRPIIDLAHPFSQTPDTAALTALQAAQAPGGRFYGPKGPGNLAGAPAEQKPYKPFAGEPDAERLWTVSEQLTGVQWPST